VPGSGSNPRLTAEEVVLEANRGCNQEYLVSQLKTGGARSDDTGGRPGQQLGLHGDGEPGLEPKDVSCAG
jgi:hypothetical protein